ncbi:MAG: hypothetical protein AB8H86_01540 [Polyangiales bacterium]
MSDIVIKQETGGYRGEAQGVEIFVPSRVVELPGKKQSVMWPRYLLLGYLALYFSVYLYIQQSSGDKVPGSMLLLAMLMPLLAIGGLNVYGSRGMSRRSSLGLPRIDVNVGGGGATTRSKTRRTIERPNQRLTLGAKSLRQVYAEGSMSRRNIPIQMQKGSRLEVRDDDGEDDGIFDTAAFWLIHSDGSEQVILENITREERGAVAKAVREALQTMV